MIYFEIILIAISLSIDALSLAIALSTSNPNINNRFIYSISVGIFHFIMPLIGFFLKKIINNIYIIPTKVIFIAVLIFIIIGIILDNKDKVTTKIINPFIFAFTVSIDSLTMGVTLTNEILLKSCLMFSIISFLFTFIGFISGHKISKILKNKSKIISVGILIIILIYNVIS